MAESLELSVPQEAESADAPAKEPVDEPDASEEEAPARVDPVPEAILPPEEEQEVTP